MTRTDYVLAMAKAMYHQYVPPEITEDEAWKDADERARYEYVRMALAAFRRLQDDGDLLEPGLKRGACLCRRELSMERRRWNYEQESGSNYREAVCATCGGA